MSMLLMSVRLLPNRMISCRSTNDILFVDVQLVFDVLRVCLVSGESSDGRRAIGRRWPLIYSFGEDPGEKGSLREVDDGVLPICQMCVESRQRSGSSLEYHACFCYYPLKLVCHDICFLGLILRGMNLHLNWRPTECVNNMLSDKPPFLR